MSFFIKPNKSWLSVIGLLLFIYLIVKNDPRSIVASLSGINVKFLFIGLLLYCVHVAVWVLKWHYLVRLHTNNVSFAQSFIIVVKSAFFSFIAPGQFGRLSRIKLLSDCAHVSLKKATYVTLLETATELFTLFLIAGAGYLMGFSSYASLSIPFTFQTMVAMIIAIVLFLLIAGKKIVSLWQKYRQYLLSTSLRPGRIGIMLILSFFFWVLAYLFIYVLAYALGINVPLVFFVACMAFASMVAMIPVSIGGIGTREATLIFLLGKASIAPHQVIALTVIGFFITRIIPAAFGLTLMTIASHNKNA